MKTHIRILILCLPLMVQACGKIKLVNDHTLAANLEDVATIGRSYYKLSGQATNGYSGGEELLRKLGFEKVEPVKGVPSTYVVTRKGRNYLFGFDVEVDNHTVVACSKADPDMNNGDSARPTYAIAVPDGGYAVIRTPLPPVPGCIFHYGLNENPHRIQYPESAIVRFRACYPELFAELEKANYLQFSPNDPTSRAISGDVRR